MEYGYEDKAMVTVTTAFSKGYFATFFRRVISPPYNSTSTICTSVDNTREA